MVFLPEAARDVAAATSETKAADAKSDDAAAAVAAAPPLRFSRAASLDSILVERLNALIGEAKQQEDSSMMSVMPDARSVSPLAFLLRAWKRVSEAVPDPANEATAARAMLEDLSWRRECVSALQVYLVRYAGLALTSSELLVSTPSIVRLDLLPLFLRLHLFPPPPPLAPTLLCRVTDRAHRADWILTSSFAPIPASAVLCRRCSCISS